MARRCNQLGASLACVESSRVEFRLFDSLRAARRKLKWPPRELALPLPLEADRPIVSFGFVSFGLVSLANNSSRAEPSRRRPKPLRKPTTQVAPEQRRVTSGARSRRAKRTPAWPAPRLGPSDLTRSFRRLALCFANIRNLETSEWPPEVEAANCVRVFSTGLDARCKFHLDA